MSLRNLGGKGVSCHSQQELQERRGITMRRMVSCVFTMTNGVSGDLLRAERSQGSSSSWDQFLFVSLYKAAAYDLISPLNEV